MSAPQRFVEWMSTHEHVDRRLGHVYRYHPRSDGHSVALCNEIVKDLVQACPVLRAQAERGEIVFGVNVHFTWPSTRKSKTLDLAAGPPSTPPPAFSLYQPTVKVKLAEVLFSCEAKTVMTEHGKSQPRIYDELSSSHEIVHQGQPTAIATGITVVNIAKTFISPLRQTSRKSLHISRHKQPDVTARMIQHLRGLPVREGVGQVGFDAYVTIVVDCDNQGEVKLWTSRPAPQPGDSDHYDTFLQQIGRLYAERFSILPHR